MLSWEGSPAGRRFRSVGARYVNDGVCGGLRSDWLVLLDLLQVTLIPTFDSLPMHDWYQDTHNRLKELMITVLGSNSTVAMQEETFPACKVEF